MPLPPQFREHLIARYDKPGLRYTSYPPPTEFHERVTESDYREWARQSNEEPIPRALSLYFHIPFCSSTCYFCDFDKIISGRSEKAEPYLEKLHREIALQAELYDRDREVRHLHWDGATPGFMSRRQSERLMDEIARGFRLGSRKASEFSIEVDPWMMHRGDAIHLRDLGFNRISVGVQDFDPRVQKAVNRMQSVDSTLAVVEEARLCGISSINLDLVYGLPHQSVESFAATLEAVIRIDPDRIAIYDFSHLPHRFPPRWRIRAAGLPDAAQKLEILQSAVDRLCAAGYEYIGMDHFARPDDELARAQRSGRLYRNFQGYTARAQCDSIGFGVSATSHVHDNYSQHCTDLDQYSGRLELGQLPVARGYSSDQDDLLRHDIIQNLVCHLRIDTEAIANAWEIDFEEYFADEVRNLDEMQQDGLLEVTKGEIRVLDTGRLLVSNICEVFDRFQRQQGHGELSRSP
jgi:oxygen-independent coproporphyrinogen-3 oxidase